MSQKVKSKRGERELCRLLHRMGYGAQRSGSLEQKRDENYPDIVTSLQNVYFEVKRGYSDTKLWHKQVQTWIDTAEEERIAPKIPVVAWRPGHSKCLAAPSGWFFFVPEDVLATTLDPRRGDVLLQSWCVVPGINSFLTIFDPEAKFTVEDPDAWDPRYDL